MANRTFLAWALSFCLLLAAEPVPHAGNKRPTSDLESTREALKTELREVAKKLASEKFATRDEIFKHLEKSITAAGYFPLANTLLKETLETLREESKDPQVRRSFRLVLDHLEEMGDKPCREALRQFIPVYKKAMQPIYAKLDRLRRAGLSVEPWDLSKTEDLRKALMKNDFGRVHFDWTDTDRVLLTLEDEDITGVQFLADAESKRFTHVSSRVPKLRELRIEYDLSQALAPEMLASFSDRSTKLKIVVVSNQSLSSYIGEPSDRKPDQIQDEDAVQAVQSAMIALKVTFGCFAKEFAADRRMLLAGIVGVKPQFMQVIDNILSDSPVVTPAYWVRTNAKLLPKLSGPLIQGRE